MSISLTGVAFALAGLIWLAASVLGFIFSVGMLVDAWKRKFSSQRKKIMWLIIMIPVPFASLLYFYLYKHNVTVVRSTSQKKK